MHCCSRIKLQVSIAPKGEPIGSIERKPPKCLCIQKYVPYDNSDGSNAIVCCIIALILQRIFHWPTINYLISRDRKKCRSKPPYI